MRRQERQIRQVKELLVLVGRRQELHVRTGMVEVTTRLFAIPDVGKSVRLRLSEAPPGSDLSHVCSRIPNGTRTGGPER